MITIPENLKKEFEVMFKAATDASFVCKTLRQRLGDLNVMTKSDDSPVTRKFNVNFNSPLLTLLVADISAQIIINHRLESAFENVVVIGEEDSTEISESLFIKIKELLSEFEISKELDLSSKEAIGKILRSNEVDDSVKRYWTVDPIDGTKGFIRGDQYSVCIALIDRETELPLISALGCPNLTVDGEEEKGMLMISVASVGNFVCKLGQGIEELKKLQKFALQTDLSKAIFTGAVVSSHTNPLEIDAIKSNFCNEMPVVRMDSQCKYGLLALDRAHVYYRRHASKDPTVRRDWQCDYIEAIWDNAPGYLFVKEAGGLVTDFEGNDLRFPPQKHFKVVGGILASMLVPELHAQVIKIVQDRNPIQ